MNSNFVTTLDDDIICAVEEGRTESLFHPRQIQGGIPIPAHRILRYLTINDLLSDCINLRQLRAIEVKGVDFSRKHFAEKVIVAWGGISGDYFPYLFRRRNMMVVSWGCISGSGLGAQAIALRFRKSVSKTDK